MMDVTFSASYRKSDGLQIAEYTYDAMGRRIRKVSMNGGVPDDSALNGLTDYVYDHDQCVEERNDENGATREFVWGQYIDELIQMMTFVETGSQSLVAGAYYPLQDLLYRTTALTDSTGAIVEAYDIDAYGNTLIFSAAGTGSNWWADDATQSVQPACEYIFTGRQYDPETEIYFYRARYYHPTLGRFLSRDPLIYVDGMNLFQYVRGNPVRTGDPDGRLDPMTCLSAAGVWGLWGCGTNAFISMAKGGNILSACVCGGISGAITTFLPCLFVEIPPLAIAVGCIAGVVSTFFNSLCRGVLDPKRCETSWCPSAVDVVLGGVGGCLVGASQTAAGDDLISELGIDVSGIKTAVATFIQSVLQNFDNKC